MKVIGNEIWNNATANSDKMTISMRPEIFHKIMDRLNSVAMNYCAYENESIVRMAINRSDVDYFKFLVGDDDLKSLRLLESTKTYNPPEMNNFGTKEFRYIPNKNYCSGSTDIMLAAAEKLSNDNIEYSGRVYTDHTTITVSRENVDKVLSVQKNIVKQREKRIRIDQNNILEGSVVYKDIKDKVCIYYPELDVETFKAIRPSLNRSGVLYSAVKRSDKGIIFAFEQNTSYDFNKLLDQEILNIRFNEKSLTAIQVGDFFEFYGDDAKTVADILNLHITKKNGEPMVGILNVDINMKMLKEAGYDVIIQSQNKPQEISEQGNLHSEKTEEPETAENGTIVPTITCEWSESNVFEDGKTYSIYEFDRLMKQADDERITGQEAAIEKYGSAEAWYNADTDDEFTKFYGYDKTKFTINMPDGSKITERQDIGDGDGGVIDFLSRYPQYKEIDELLIAVRDLQEAESKLEAAKEQKAQYEADKAAIEKERASANDEQLSLFGDPEPIQQKAEKSKSEFSKGPVVDGVQVYEALAEEIMRGTGFVNGKLRVQEFYDENNPSIDQLADFLKKEYGIGGHSGKDKISFVDYDSKGMYFTFDNGEKFKHSWYNVAVMTSAKLKSGEYITPDDISRRDKLVYSEVNDEPIKTDNFIITDDTLGEGGAKSKFQANIVAIETLKTIESENRYATPEEQDVMSKYVGWGGLASAFDEHNNNWSSEFSQLKELLTDKEYSSARASTLDSFYTSPVIIDGIYSALERFGFKGGNVLEPAMGIGNFFGRMPEKMQKNSKLHGVEIDSISGRIAKLLYPDADIQVKGFEQTNFNDNSFDIAIGNIPFGDFGVIDKSYDSKLKIHDYFFAKALDKVKVGGIVAFITSKGTLDKRDISFRRELAEKADLIGAIRLPNTAFKANAGTEVTSDIIFLQKRSEPPQNEPEWVQLGQTESGLTVNKYFIDNPDMILGKLVKYTNPKSSGTKVVPLENADLKDQILTAVTKMNAVISTERTPEIKTVNAENNEVSIPQNLRNHSFFVDNNKVYFKFNESRTERWEKDSSNAHKRAIDFINLRDCTRAVLDAQERNCSDDELNTLQGKLNIAYDEFYKKYGLLHGRGNNTYFRDDISYPLVCSLEKEYEHNKLIEKSDLFFKRTIKAAKPIDHVETAQEALILSVSEKACVDLEYMNRISGIPEDVLIKDLNGEIYPVPELSDDNNIIYQEASEYLSGDIRKKLDNAIAAAEDNPIYAQNVTALLNALPEKLKAGDISVKIGAMWIEPKYYQQFMYETFGTPDINRADHKRFSIFKNPVISVNYSEHTGSWKIENKGTDRSVTVCKSYGSKRRNAYQIFEDLLNLKDPKVTKTILDSDGKEKRVVDIEATRVAQQKAEKIREQFKDWIFKDADRRAELVEKYNNMFNSIRPREYDGSHLTFPGMNIDIQLHSHQKDAIAHALYGGNTLFAHSVGAGKTYEMIATAMESKRLGLCTKTLIAVPNNITEQIGDDFMQLYPNANIMIATKNDFKKTNRQKLISKIATGNFDAIIIGHSQLGMVPISKERQEMQLNKQIDDIIIGIEKLKREEGSNYQVKAMERTKKSLNKQLEKLKKTNQDDIVTFEQLGVDKLIVDEAHEFKNLFCATKLQNVAGISSSASQRALDLFMKCQYLDEKTGGKGVVFATGTPISNSVTELHTMMKYLQYDFLKEKGLNHFDNWVSIFGEQKTEYELAPAGNSYRPRTRIANYCNLPELMSMFKQCADVKTADVLNLDVPECELHIVNAEPSDLQKALVSELSSRADDVQKGTVDPSNDNMLKITSDGRKVGLDPRLIDPSFEDSPQSKLNQCVNNVFRIYNETSEDKLTQIVFCDLGVPHKNNVIENDNEDDSKSSAECDSLEEECDFCVYDDIKKKLTEHGIPNNEIAFIHSAKTEKAKSELFEKVRKGEVRILIGSTSKMGMGTNVQDRLVALHDLDIPWRPADLEQRRGRMVRQGNINNKVHLYRYVTKGTFDAYSYQLLESKQKFISQIITSKSPARVCEDVDQQALSYSEIKALCTGDERIKELMVLDNEVKSLTALHKEWQNTRYEMEDFLKKYPTEKSHDMKMIQNIEADIDICKKLPTDPETNLPAFKITILGNNYTDKTEAAKALKTACVNVLEDGNAKVIGDIHGFPISIDYSHAQKCLSATLQGTALHKVYFSDSFPHNLRKIENLIFTMENRLEKYKINLNKLEIDADDARKILDEPFKFTDELSAKSERLSLLRNELNREAAQAASNNKGEKTFYFERAKLKRNIEQRNKSTIKEISSKAKSVCL